MNAGSKDYLYKCAKPLLRSQHSGCREIGDSKDRIRSGCRSPSRGRPSFLSYQSPTTDSSLIPCHLDAQSGKKASNSEQQPPINTQAPPATSPFQEQASECRYTDTDNSGSHGNMRRFSSDFITIPQTMFGKEEHKGTLTFPIGRVITSRYLNTASKMANSGRHAHDSYGHSVSLTSDTTTRKSRRSNKLGQSVRSIKSEVKRTCDATKLSVPLIHQPSQTPTSLKLTQSAFMSTPLHAEYTTPSFLSSMQRTCKVNSDTEIQTELLCTRLLQAILVDAKSAQSLTFQDVQAKFQCLKLWKTVEEEKKEVFCLRQMVELQEKTATLEKCIEGQLHSIAPTLSKLKLLEQFYSNVTKALDTIGHEVVFKNTLHAEEGVMQQTLSPAEKLLGDISATVNEFIPKAFPFTGSTECLVKTLEKHCKELQMCWEDLFALIETQMRDASLFFEQRQRI